jgi:anti-sigma factor RsiW
MDSRPPDLDTLMAYADGALPADEAARIAQYLATDAQARAQVAQLRAAAAMAAQAFEQDLQRPVPPALRAAVDQTIARQRGQRQATAAAEPGAGRAAGARLLDWLGLSGGPRFGFAAAAVALLAGVVGFVIGAARPVPPAWVSAPPMGLLVASAAEQAEIGQLLDTLPSGQRRALAGEAQIELVASFRDGGGTLCREFNLQRAGAAVLAVACRDPQRWAVTFASAAPPGGSFAPAASAATALDAYVASIGGGAALSPADEARALATR